MIGNTLPIKNSLSPTKRYTTYTRRNNRGSEVDETISLVDGEGEDEDFSYLIEEMSQNVAKVFLNIPPPTIPLLPFSVSLPNQASFSTERYNQRKHNEILQEENEVNKQLGKTKDNSQEVSHTPLFGTIPGKKKDTIRSKNPQIGTPQKGGNEGFDMSDSQCDDYILQGKGGKYEEHGEFIRITSREEFEELKSRVNNYITDLEKLLQETFEDPDDVLVYPSIMRGLKKKKMKKKKMNKGDSSGATEEPTTIQLLKAMEKAECIIQEVDRSRQEVELRRKIDEFREQGGI